MKKLTGSFAGLVIAVVLVSCSVVTKVRSDGSDHKYKAGDSVPLYANKVGPFHNPSETYRYFDLPFCVPDDLKEKKEALGEVLNGDRLVSAPYKLDFLADKESEEVCKRTLTKEQVAQFRKAVTKDYYFQMYYDDLPIWGFLGKVDKEGKADPSDYKYYLFKHLQFDILYNKDRVIEINVRPDNLQAYARGCWGLLPAFCRHPTDTYQNFGSLVKLLVSFLTKDSFMHQNVAIALQELVNENRSVLGPNVGASEFAPPPKTSEIDNSLRGFESKPYPKKNASRNIKALASCSEELLQALIDVFFGSPPETRAYVKDTIRCLASITDSSVTKRIFISTLEKFQLINDLDESGKQGNHTGDLADQQKGNFTSSEKEAKRCLTVELASSLVEGASEDLITSIMSLIKHTLQESNEDGQSEAYNTLGRMFEEHSWLRSSHVDELMDFLLGLKPPVNITTLRSRFACFQTLLVDTLKRSLDEENSKAFLVLNEVIVTIKDSTEEARKAAYDMLIGINSALQKSLFATSDEPYQKLITMIMGYLSGSSPHIMSGAVSALSVLVHNNAEICLLVPDLVPSVLALLHTKAVEVIKAVLGFVKVLVSCHQAKNLQNILPDILNEVLRWSSVSRHHFRAKVTVILEILMRRCGSASVKLATPENHRKFVKDVLENRQGKTSSKESGAADMEPQALESSPRGMQRKRKHEDPSIPPEDSGKMESRFRKRGKKLVKKAGSHNDDRLAEGQSHGNERNRRNFNGDPTASRKVHMKHTKGRKEFRGASYRPGAASKLGKHKNLRGNRRKS